MTDTKQDKPINQSKKDEPAVIPAATLPPAGGDSRKPLLIWRKIIIETDGDNVKLVEATVSGKLEMTAILEKLLEFYRR